MKDSSSLILDVEGLEVWIDAESGRLHPVRGVNFSVGRGETLGIVGESGCGKSLTALALMGLLPRRARKTATRIVFAGENIGSFTSRQLAAMRGSRISMIFQDAMTALNPVYTIGSQLEDVHMRHQRSSRKQARDRAVDLLERVGISAASDRLGQYPHELSGGLRQRVMIAMALMCEPELIIADEPTTALDVTIQAEILRLLKTLQQEYGMALILVTHDLGVVAQVADKVAVMYAGEIIEHGLAPAILTGPGHPYTSALLDCLPIPGRTKPRSPLGTIPGIVPLLGEDLKGCAFANRCCFAEPGCWRDEPTVERFSEGRLIQCRRAREIALHHRRRRSEPRNDR